jgi:DNA polymerase-4
MILHIDMDAFYASVEQRDRPELRGLPVIVGGSSAGRGVVCAASYEARKFGVHSAQPAVTARRLCPDGVFVAPRMKHYAQVSQQIFERFLRYTPLVEPLSLDEAFLDVSGSEKLFGPAEVIAEKVKHDIRTELGLVASVGIAPNKFLAKIASDLDKPDGLTVVDPERTQEFLDPLPVGRLWGVGRVTNRTLELRGIRTIAQLRKLPTESLRHLFGEQGEHLSRLAHGIDDRAVTIDRKAKSISHETTFPVDVSDREILAAWLLELSDQLGSRLRRSHLAGRTLQLKIRFHDFRTLTRAATFAEPTNGTQAIADAALALYRDKIASNHPPVRLLGVGISRFDDRTTHQQSLFAEEEHQQQRQIDTVADQIRQKFGHDSLARGSRLLHNIKHRPQPGAKDEL